MKIKYAQVVIGSHGGGDKVMLEYLFGVKKQDNFNRTATYMDGAMSILTGIAANKSIATEQPVNVLSLVELPGFRRI